MATGTVKFFHVDRGYGFIEQPEGAEDVFVHISCVEGHVDSLTPGQRVEFTIGVNARNGKTQAERVRVQAG
jgi:CspA family cold shock protein